MKKGGESVPSRGNSMCKGPVVREPDKCKGLKEGLRQRGEPLAQAAAAQAGEGWVGQAWSYSVS